MLEKFSWLKEQNEYVFNEVMTQNVYRVSPEDFKGREVLDIGANNGTFSIMAAYYGADVIAVEPVFETFKQLTENVVRAGVLNGCVTPYRNLVTDTNEQLYDISVHDDSGKNSLYNITNRSEVVQSVNVQSLLDMFRTSNVMIKMDCEGAEYDILLNIRPSDFKKVTELNIETHTEMHPTYKGRTILENAIKHLGLTMVDRQQIYEWWWDEKGIMHQKEHPTAIEKWRRV